MNLPEQVVFLTGKLESAGFEAYAVGGCVRDTLMGRIPSDWDMCTSASPDEMKQVFSDMHVVETGLRHGTLTVVLDHVPYEITSFRLEGAYTDHRRPDSVTFVTDLREDLSRRDFTVNAMAAGMDGSVIDMFGGQDDISSRLVRCVGDPEERFREDALRVLRALRFASVLDFDIEEKTAEAALKLAPTLSMVSAERISSELMKTLCGPGAGRILRRFPGIFTVIIPDLAVMQGYDQNNHHHKYDLWEHTVRVLENVPPVPDMRLAMLLHDVGKPAVCTKDSWGESHFPGHQAASEVVARRVVDDLKLDRATAERVCLLVRWHDINFHNEQGEPDLTRSFLLRRLNRFGEKDLRDLIRIHRADRIGTGISSVEKEDARMKLRMDALDALIEEQACFSLRDLAVNGRDLTERGFRGREVGETLNALLRAVMDGKADNSRDELLALLPEPAQKA